MGNTSSEDKRLSSKLKKEKKEDAAIKKLLFLGAGGSGKSTIFKQLRRLHGEGWDKDYKMSFLPHIESQIIYQMKLAIECVEVLAEEEVTDQHGDFYKPPDDAKYNPYSKLSSDAQTAVTTLNAVKDSKLTQEIATACKILWNEAIIKQIYQDRATMKIQDSSAYFWDKVEDIIKPQYVPTEDDILLVQHRTTGVTEQIFTISKNTFHIFDVGGQQSERKKWIHCFETVTCVIFVVSLSCYDETMFEDDNVNSMVDSLQLFSNICNNEWFEKTSMILFLNKKDLFIQKLAENKAITLCPTFEGYKGDQTSFDETTEYISDIFVAENKSKDEDKKIFIHLTCATDRDNVKKVFTDVQTIIIQKALQSAGVMNSADFM